jgi:RNA polymerase sigma-70 factor (ECF subfamily)
MRTLSGAEAVAGQLATFHRMATLSTTRPALVNGTAGLVNTIDGELVSIMSFTITHGKIAAIDILSDPDRLAQR